MEVARDSYALTLWTYWHLEQREKRDRFLERRDRFDLAGLIAIGRRDGKAFQTLMDSHELEAFPERAATQRAEALAHVAAHSKMKRVRVEGQMMRRDPEEA